jgi:hypothetical protein
MRSPYHPPASIVLDADTPARSRPIVLWVVPFAWMLAGVVEIARILQFVLSVGELRFAILLRVGPNAAIAILWVLGATLLFLMKRSSILLLASACILEVVTILWNAPWTLRESWLPFALGEWFLAAATVAYAIYLGRKGRLR